jgi:hypothetical protein
MFICKHCKKEFFGLSTANKANHSRWCDENPKRKEYTTSLSLARQHIKNRKNQFTKAKEEGRPIPLGTMTGKQGSFLGKKHSAKTIEHLREKALNSTHRRLVRSIREYKKLDGNIVMLDSSWEETLAIRLDELNIKWIRPTDPIKWIDKNGVTRNYFPDFYLIDFDIYLDPKNPYAYASQKDKIEIITKLMPNLRILTTLEECKQFILGD